MNPYKRVIVEVPKCWKNDQRGRFFEDLVAKLLSTVRYRVTSRIRFTGMEVDVLAEHIDSGTAAHVECKFEKTRLRTSTLSKAFGNANNRNIPLVYVFSTSPLGSDAKGWLKENESSTSPTKVSYHGPESLFEWLKTAEQIALPTSYEEKKSISLTLLVTPEFYCWVAEEGEGGIPKIAKVFPIKSKGTIDFQIVENLWPSVCVVNGETVASGLSESQRISSAEEEIVTPVSIANGFDDYRPCSPKDFVGRKSLQNEVFAFLEDVRNKRNPTRSICLRGPSGYGKSSTVIKLADEVRSKKNRDKYFLYPIDIRSARSPLFVAKAVRAALQRAVDEKFVNLPGENVSVGSTGLLLDSESIRLILEDLDRSKRLIVIFFDQFEELFTKESLSGIFDAFNYLALEVDALESNIVLGFSWRTGLNPPEDHESFSFWHGLRDRRFEILVEPFKKKEAPHLLSKLSKHIGQKLNERLKKRLLVDGQGLPWLLKKLSIHVSHQIGNGVSQQELLSKQFNIESLFDEDLEMLTKEEQVCLQYVAKHSPVARIDVVEKFDDTPDKLMKSRLILKTGPNYILYWDIFREYLTTGKVPSVHLTYIPRTQLTVVMKAIGLLQKGSLSSEELAKSVGYTNKGCLNIIIDLQNFFLAKREQDQIVLQPEVQDFTPVEIADYLSKQLKEHIVVHKLVESVNIDRLISRQEFQDILESAYPNNSFKKRTLETYSTRIMQWLISAGFLEEHGKQVIRPLRAGSQKGKIPQGQQANYNPDQLSLLLY